jgi:hypothetical protein
VRWAGHVALTRKMMKLKAGMQLVRKRTYEFQIDSFIGKLKLLNKIRDVTASSLFDKSI